MKTKLLALALACFMVISMLPVSIFAAEHEHACPGDGEKHTLELCPDATLVEVVPSQCGEWGYTLYACPDCGDYFADNFNKEEGNHTWKVTAEAVEATCTEDGKTQEETCEVCGKKQGGEVVKATGHKWSETGRDGDCLTGGFIYEKCDNCGEERQIAIDGTGKGHTWSENPVKIEKEPTWNEEGLAVYECTVCGEPKDVVIFAEHDHKLKEHKAADPTCTEDGSIAYWECEICGVYYADANATVEVEKDKAGAYITVIPALGHITEGVEVKEEMAPTCSEEGWKLVVCGRCEKDVTVAIEATGHSFEEDKPVKIEPTCTAWGFDVYACTVCGYVKRTNPVEPLGHTPYDDAESEIKSYNKSETLPTCTDNGLRTWACGRCDEDQKEILPATGHATVTVKVDATCADFGYEFTYCKNENCPSALIEAYVANEVSYDVTVDGKAVHLIECKVGNTVDPNKHTFKEGDINPATCTEAGDKVGYCVDCNEYATEVVPPLGHSFKVLVGTAQAQSCEKGEVLTYKCERCDATTDVATDKTAIGHKYPETGVTVAPTCSADGYTGFECENCGKLDKRDIVKYQPRTEYTAEQAEAEHLGLGEAIEVFREGNCLTIGLYRHLCSDCGEYILVVIDGTGKGHVDPKTYTGEGEFAGKEPTCTDKGYTAAYTCSVCNNFIESVEIPATGHDWKDATCTEVKTCKTCGATEGEALGHDWEVIPEVPATCTEAGVSEYKVCNRDCCKDAEGNKLTEGKTTIPAINHKNTGVEDSRVVNCEEYGYTHYVCPDCGDEYIKGYKPATGHDWTLDEENSVAPTCTEEGKNVYVCGNENCPDGSYDETVPAIGHKNEAGETIVDDCADTVEDRDCVNCKTTIGKTHNETFTVSVPATCKDYGYDLAVCVKCEASTVTNVDDTYLADHTFCDWYVTVEPTFTEGGKAERKCSVCGLVETKDVAAKTGIEYVLDIDNAVVSGAGYADSSTVAVKVSLNSAKVDVWGLTFDLVYDEDVVTFVSAEFVSENFITSPMAHDNGGYVSVIASVPNAADQTTQNVTIEGTEEFVILYFTINNADATEATFRFDNCEARNNKGELINSAGETETIEIRMFMDVNADGDVNLADALEAYKIVVGESETEYDVTLDVNKDGEVNTVDFVAIYEYLVGSKTYEDMVNLAA